MPECREELAPGGKGEPAASKKGRDCRGDCNRPKSRPDRSTMRELEESAQRARQLFISVTVR